MLHSDTVKHPICHTPHARTRSALVWCGDRKCLWHRGFTHDTLESHLFALQSFVFSVYACFRCSACYAPGYCSLSLLCVCGVLGMGSACGTRFSWSRTSWMVAELGVGRAIAIGNVGIWRCR